MFFIPGIVITVLTFPGVIVHEAGHLFFCRVFGLQVYNVCFFQFKNPAGYVIHESSDDFTAQFFVSMGPFISNTLLLTETKESPSSPQRHFCASTDID